MEIMISVLTLTYKRHHLLEEAIQSFLLQELPPECEMVVINDNAEVDYVYNHPKVRIINHKERFPSIGAKLEWGFKQCKYDYIYRLDDDDLLAPWALRNVQTDIESNPGFEIYRSKGMHFFLNNIYEGEGGSVNNGNVYTKAYIDRIKVPETSIGEDSDMTFGNNSKIYTSKLQHTMIYRWGMGTLHISGMGNVANEAVLAQADKVLDDTKGNITLNPHFKNDYYEQIKKPLK
jgi:glycosyltransferase involved in cell wall biosynthesis